MSGREPDKGAEVRIPIIVATVVAALLAVALIISISPGSKSARTPFDSHMAEYTSLSGATAVQPYLKGKILPVNLQHGTVDAELLRLLPEASRAQSPDEVGSVVWLDCAIQSRGECGCEVIVWDLQARVETGTYAPNRFPPSQMEGGHTTSTTCPSSDDYELTTSYLSGLPRDAADAAARAAARAQREVQSRPVECGDTQRLRPPKGPTGRLKISNDTWSSLTVEISEPKSKTSKLPFYLQGPNGLTADISGPAVLKTCTIVGTSSIIELAPGSYHISVASRCGHQDDDVRISSGGTLAEAYYCEERRY